MCRRSSTIPTRAAPIAETKRGPSGLIVPLSSSIVGASESLSTDVDTRWTMAYAAALGDSARCYFDTLDTSGIIAHPLFPVCFEWPIITKMRQALERSGLTPAEARRGVHASHDLSIHAPV